MTKASLYCQIIRLVRPTKLWGLTSIDLDVEKSNKYMDQSSSKTRSALQEAKALLEGNGSLSEAALMLEAAIQKGDLGEGGYEAWILLGDVRTMDEREDAGMRAMMQGVRLAEAAGVPGPGMLVSILLSNGLIR
jgi:peroxin-5